jgi:hypothetical protein
MKANFYVDGFNLYCGLCDAKLHGFIWLDIQKLCELLIAKHETLGRILYFTCLPHHDPRKFRDHTTYISALEASCPAIEVFYGDFTEVKPLIECKNCRQFFPPPDIRCPRCGWKKPRISHLEKQTDVGLAVNLVRDALSDDFDVAYIISGDTDLIPALRMAKSVDTPRSVIVPKKIGIYFPPSRRHEGFKGVAKFALEIRPHEVKACQLPIPVKSPTGDLEKPLGWYM